MLMGKCRIVKGMASRIGRLEPPFSFLIKGRFVRNIVVPSGCSDASDPPSYHSTRRKIYHEVDLNPICPFRR